MELEDERDAVTARQQETDELLAQAQRLADAKLEESAHLREVTAAAQSHAASVQSQLQAAAAEVAALRTEMQRLEAEASRTRDSLESALRATENRAARLAEELAAIKASRSWRWTAWMRGPERNPTAEGP
jgi:hypothetical protein